MRDTLASLQRKISSAQELQSVVRTMKAMAAASIGQYEKSVQSLDEYYRTIELGLLACFRQQDISTAVIAKQQFNISQNGGAIVAVVFGSDQGVVGQFNDVMAQFVMAEIEKFPREKKLWTVGERIQARLAETGITVVRHFALPNSIAAITSLVSEILLALENGYEQDEISEVYLFHNQPQSGAGYSPSCMRLCRLMMIGKLVLRRFRGLVRICLK